MSSNALKEIISKRFARYTHTTNPAIWNAIETQLDEKKSDRMAIWFWLLNGLAASIFIALMIGSNESSPSLTHFTNSGISQTSEKRSNNDAKQSQNQKRLGQKLAAEVNMNFTEKTNSNFHEKSNIHPKNSLHELGLSAEIEAPQNTSVLVSNLTPKSAQKIDVIPLKSTRIPQLEWAIVSAKKSFRPSVWLSIQGTYLYGIPPVEPPIITVNMPQKPTLNRGTEFTFISHISMTRKCSLGIGFGYSDAKASTTFLQETGTTTLLTTGDYQQFNFVVPIQVKYNLLSRNKLIFSAGLNLQPEYSRLDVRTKTEAISSGTVSISEFTVLQSSKKSTTSAAQLAIEPFAQIELLLHPRLSIYSSLGYRNYLAAAKFGDDPFESRNNLSGNLGIRFKIR